MTSRGYTAREVAEATGVSYRQLDYWARTELVRPSINPATGSGSTRRYSHRDIVTTAIIARLLDTGLRLERIRDVIAALDDQSDDTLTDAWLVTTYAQVFIVHTGEQLAALALQHPILQVLSIRAIADSLTTP